MLFSAFFPPFPIRTSIFELSSTLFTTKNENVHITSFGAHLLPPSLPLTIHLRHPIVSKTPPWTLGLFFLPNFLFLNPSAFSFTLDHQEVRSAESKRIPSTVALEEGRSLIDRWAWLPHLEPCQVKTRKPSFAPIWQLRR